MKQPELGIHIAQMRMQKRLTQKDLADEINVDIRTIQRIESGKVTPRMYTIKLLSDVLGAKIPVESNTVQSNTGSFNRQIKWSFILAVVFSINYIPVIFNIITGSLNPFINMVAVLIHTSTIVFAVRGFYLVGRLNNNNILMITSFLAMMLLPLLSITDLWGKYFFNPAFAYLLFNLACINAIGQGIGFFIEGYQRKKSTTINLYKIAGIITIFQSLLFLSASFKVIATALIISALCNVLTSLILYLEYKESESADEKVAAYTALA